MVKDYARNIKPLLDHICFKLPEIYKGYPEIADVTSKEKITEVIKHIESTAKHPDVIVFLIQYV